MDENYEEFDDAATHALPGACQTLSVQRYYTEDHVGAEVSARSIRVTVSGGHRITVRDAGGRLVRMLDGTGPQVYSLDNIRVSGVVFVEVTTEKGTFLGKKVILPR